MMKFITSDQANNFCDVEHLLEKEQFELPTVFVDKKHILIV